MEAFGYWSLTDFFEEVSDFGSVYHGGYGLFTYNGIPKSGWHAMRFLNMLGDVKVGGGDGWMATKSDEGIQLLMDHYCHYDGLYCLRYRKLTDPEKAYSVFSKGWKKGNTKCAGIRSPGNMVLPSTTGSQWACRLI